MKPNPELRAMQDRGETVGATGHRKPTPNKCATRRGIIAWDGDGEE
jgi:hypothetical protein